MIDLTRAARALVAAPAYGENIVEDSDPHAHNRDLFQSEGKQVQKMLEDERNGIEGGDHEDKRLSEIEDHPLYDDLKNLARYNIPSEYQTGTPPPGPSAPESTARVEPEVDQEMLPVTARLRRLATFMRE